MDIMKTSNHILAFLDSNKFKNFVIVFGLCLSLFTITSFDSVSGERSTEIDEEQVDCLPLDADEVKAEATPAKVEAKKEKKTKTYHNFIASYLLQESSVDRQNKKKEKETTIIGNLAELRRMIFSTSIRIW